jgi:hypothetical protein
MPCRWTDGQHGDILLVSWRGPCHVENRKLAVTCTAPACLQKVVGRTGFVNNPFRRLPHHGGDDGLLVRIG